MKEQRSNKFEYTHIHAREPAHEDIYGFKGEYRWLSNFYKLQEPIDLYVSLGCTIWWEQNWMQCGTKRCF